MRTPFRDATAVYTFVASMDLREELDDLRWLVAAKRAEPASLSDVIRTALRIGLTAMQKEARKRGGPKVRDPYDGPLPSSFERKAAKKSDWP